MGIQLLPGFQGVNMIRLLVLVAGCVALAQSLSCACGSSPCQTPVCCDSGFYTLDECGCCLTCAKAEDEVCGGPFRIAGNCAAGLRCLRQCECKSVQGNNCIFPFQYKGVTYNSCTNTELKCNEGFLFNMEGVCVNG